MAFTKVVGPGIHTLSNILSHNINSSGIITATKFVGPFDNAIIGGGTTISSDGINVTGIVTATGLDINGNGDISGNLVVGGNLTANGDLTTLNTTLREVELLRVDANSALAAGIITQRGAGDALAVDFDYGSNVIERAFTIHKDSTYGELVGIGTNNPGTSLHIQDVYTTPYPFNAPVAGFIGALKYPHELVLENAVAGVNGSWTGIMFRSGANSSGSAHGNARVSAVQTADNQADLTFSTRSGTFGERLRITGAGLVGIGTTVPTVKLDVAGAIKTTNITSDSSNLSIENTADRVMIKSANRIDIADNFIRFQNRAQDETLLEAVAGASGYVKLFHNDSLTASVTQDALTVTGRTANSGMVEIASNQGANNNDRFRIHKTSAASRLTIQNYSSGSWVENIRITAGGAVELKHSDGTNHFETTAGGAAISNIQNNQGLDLNGVSNNTCIRFMSTGSSPAHAYRIAYHSTTNYAFNSPSITFDKTDTSGNYDSPIAAISDTGFHLADNKKLHVGGVVGASGATGDLRIYHDTAVNRIDSDGHIVSIRNISGGTQNMVRMVPNGAVELFYDGSKKFSTSGIGVTVTGEVAATQDYPTLQPTLDINFANTKSLDPRINYVRTGTASYLNEFGKIVTVGENEPRFDHDPTTLEPKGLLIEESRQNMFRGTADMGSNAYAWPVGGARGRRGVNVEGPDGKMTALQNIYLGTSGDLNIYYETATGATEMATNNSTAYTFSVFAKAAYGNSYINGIRLRAHSPNRSASFNVVNGTVGVSNEGSSSILSKTIVEYPNGWYRCIMTFTSGTDSNHGFQIYVENEGGDAAALNNSSANGEAMYFWGAQLEIGSFATSFIPTQSRDGRNRGTQTTRGLDIVTIDKDDIDGIFNPEEGTMFYEASVTNLTNDNQPIVAFRDVSNTAASYHAMGHAIGGSAGSVRVWARNAASTNVHLTVHTGLVADTFYKHMYGYKYNDYSDAFAQGTTLKQSNTTSGNNAMNAPGLVDELRFGGYYTSPEGTYTLDSGHIRRFSYWPKKLTNSQIKTYVS